MACDSGQGMGLWLNTTSFKIWLDVRGTALTPKRPDGYTEPQNSYHEGLFMRVFPNSNAMSHDGGLIILNSCCLQFLLIYFISDHFTQVRGDSLLPK